MITRRTPVVAVRAVPQITAIVGAPIDLRSAAGGIRHAVSAKAFHEPNYAITVVDRVHCRNRMRRRDRRKVAAVAIAERRRGQ